MEQINETVKVLSAFSAIAVSLTSIIALLSLIFKPVRKAIVWCYKKITGSKDKNEAVLKRIDDVENTLSKKIDGVQVELTEKINSVSKQNDDNEKDYIRWTILDFANSCRNNRQHTKDEFEHIFRMNDKYERMLAVGEKNSYFEAEFDYIKHLYAQRQEKNDFL